MSFSSPDASPPRDPQAEPKERPTQWLILATVAVVAVSAILSSYLQPVRRIPRVRGESSLIGKPLPEFKVEGWLNGEPLTREGLIGQVVVVDAWAFWCGPCRELSPELKRLHALYAPRGVQFIGLTSEGSQTLEESRKFLEQEGLEWPQAYGALAPLLSLDAYAIPQVWVFGRDGKMTWDMQSEETLDEALEAALRPDSKSSAG